MRTVSKRLNRRTGRATQDADPHRYGWRYVRMVAPDGFETFDQVPSAAVCPRSRE